MSHSGKIMIVEDHDESLVRELKKRMGDDVIFMTPSEAKQFIDTPIPKVEDVVHKFEGRLPKHIELKRGLCKGKHTYSNVNNEWVCKCGTKI